ncbi:transcriptional regulator [bacterium]|nr:transcriptional regulator [bacterium]
MYKLLNELKSPKEIEDFFKEILTEKEINTLSKRWRILQMLASNSTQREIAQELSVSLCKVTRGAKILKNEKSITAQYLTKGK